MRIDVIMRRLRSKYLLGAFPGRDPKATALKMEERDPFRVLIATILSHRTRDEKTHEAVENLFREFKDPEEIAKANKKKLERLIRPVGFYRVKAGTIKEVSKIIANKFKGEVPKDFDTLMSLPSVGRKTANCVLVYGFGIEAIPVDSHVERISKRLGLVMQGSDTVEVEHELQKVVPKKYWLDINELFVRFGQEICKPIGPKCEICDLRNLCRYYKLTKGVGK